MYATTMDESCQTARIWFLLSDGRKEKWKLDGQKKNSSSSQLHLFLQDSDNPDLRDRGYIYWRLLSTDPVAAKEVVLAEKPLISEETDLIEPTLLEELICHIGTLASVYHKPPSAFVEGSRGVQHKRLPGSGGS